MRSCTSSSSRLCCVIVERLLAGADVGAGERDAVDVGVDARDGPLHGGDVVGLRALP